MSGFRFNSSPQSHEGNPKAISFVCPGGEKLLAGVIVEGVERDRGFGDAPEFVRAAALSDAVPGADFLELGHDLAELFDEHFGEAFDRHVAAGSLIESGCGLHEADEPGAFEDGARESRVGLDEEIGDRYFERFLPAIDIGELEVGGGLFLVANLAHLDAHASGGATDGDTLLVADFANAVEPLGLFPLIFVFRIFRRGGRLQFGSGWRADNEVGSQVH